MIAKVRNHIVKRRAVLLPWLVLAAVSVLPAQTPAESGKVGIINVQNALVSTKDGQKAAAELEAKANPKRKELEAKQAEINSLQDQLQKGQNTLSESSKQSLARDLDRKTKNLKRDAEDAEAEWNQDQQKVLQQLGQRVMAVVDKYAKDNGYTLVLDVSSPQTPVLYASNTVDITKDVVELYDKNSPGPVNVSGNALTAPAASKAASPTPAPTK